MRTDRQTDRQTDREKERQTGRQAGRLRVAFRICCVKGPKNKVFTTYSKIIINLPVDEYRSNDQ